MSNLTFLGIGVFIGIFIGMIIMSVLSFSRNSETDNEIENLKFQIEVLTFDINKYKKDMQIHLDDISKYEEFWEQSRLADKQAFEMYIWKGGQVNK